MVSMKDIAEQLNISRCTVSNILNNRLEGKSYRRETIKMVLDTAKELGYVSNSVARSLKTGFTGTIAIVVPDIANAFYIKIIKEVERRANENGNTLIICMAEEILDKETSALTMLQSRRVDGVLISPVSVHGSLKNEYPYKIVCFDRTAGDGKYPHVLIDNYAAGRTLAEKMIADGAREPLFLAGSPSDFTVAERYRGFCDALGAHGWRHRPENYLMGLYDEQTAYVAMTKAMQDHKIFDSVFLCTNFFVYGVLRALKANNRSVVSVGGFERFTGMDLLASHMHVIDQPEAEMGRVAFDLLFALLKGQNAESKILNYRAL